MSRQSLPRQERGSLLVVAMLLAAIIALTLTSYIRTSQATLEISNRAFYNNAALNLAEAGVEQAMWSLNKEVAISADAWTGWTHNGTNAQNRWSDWTYGQNTTGAVRAYIANYTSTTPVIIARATITPPRGTPIEKWLKIQLGKRSRFANGLVAKNSITFNGNNAFVDSWDSDPDDNPATAAVPYSNGVRHDKGSVGSVSVLNTAVLLNNADIWGYAATGAAQPQVGSNGSILGADSPVGVKVDPARVSTDFTASFDPVVAPAATPSIGVINVTSTLGTAGTSSTVTCSSIGLSSGKQLNILGDVTLIVTAAAGTSAIDIAGNSGINLPAGSSLTIYTAGDIKIAGNGVANSNAQPITLQIWGTSTSTTSAQDIQIAGNGALKGIVYAPNANVKINGNGEVMGSIVANNVTLVGNAAFHYDESLTDLGAGQPYGITQWTELTSASSREAYASVLSF